MSELRDYHLSRGDGDFERFEVSPYYLTELACRAAVEVDNHLAGRNKSDFQHAYELALIFSRHQLKTNNDFHSFPYMAVWRALKTEDKQLREIQDLSKEVETLRKEILQIPESGIEKMTRLRGVLLKISREFLAEEHLSYRFGLTG